MSKRLLFAASIFGLSCMPAAADQIGITNGIWANGYTKFNPTMCTFYTNNGNDFVIVYAAPNKAITVFNGTTKSILASACNRPVTPVCVATTGGNGAAVTEVRTLVSTVATCP